MLLDGLIWTKLLFVDSSMVTVLKNAFLLAPRNPPDPPLEKYISHYMPYPASLQYLVDSSTSPTMIFLAENLDVVGN